MQKSTETFWPTLYVAWTFFTRTVLPGLPSLPAPSDSLLRTPKPKI